MGSSFLKVTNRLGMELSVAIEGDTDPLDVARVWQRQGWRAVTIPPGGLRMPLIMAETFDWSLIDAREDTLDGDRGVWFDGMFYKRRDLAANPKKNMGEVVKYSRGAKSTDDPVYVEGDDDGNFKYVTLVAFRGNSMPIREFERRLAAQHPKPEPAPPLKGEQLADAIARGDAPADGDAATIGPDALQWIMEFAKKHQIDSATMFAQILETTRGRTNKLIDVTVGEARAIGEALKAKVASRRGAA